VSAAVDQRRFGALAQELGPAATLIYDSIAATVGTGALDDLSRAMWARYADGEISDDEATYLGSLIDRRRPAAARERLAGKRSCVILRFPKRKPQRAPERQQAYERRHRLAYSGVMPRHLAAKFTIGEMACLRIVGDECKAKGRCDVTLSEIAARAGVCRKTAKRAMDKAGRWGERLIEVKERPREGRKHLPNVVRIVSKDWIAWLARRSAAKPEADEQQLANGSATISQAAPAIGGQIGAPTDNILNDDYTGRARERPTCSNSARR
jgi:hypothetical protein